MSFGILFFSLFIFVPTWAVGRNCSHSDGYIRDHRDNVTDNCDYECGWVQCGDVCISSVTGRWCYCGEQMMNSYTGLHYCCVDHSPDNRTQCSVDKYRNGHCPQGRVVSQSGQTCNNHCFNDYETSAVVSARSHYHCSDKWLPFTNPCMGAKYMCRGYPLCDDSRDVSECDENLKCIQGSGFSHGKGVLVSDLTSGHYFCDYGPTHNDGQYDTITREDETDLNILSRIRRVYVNIPSITECHNATEFNLPGLMCGEKCVVHRDWCLEKAVSSCGKYNFSTTNKQLCANTRFWKRKTCDAFYSSGDKAAVGRRCTGSIHQCSYPWYTSSIYFYEVKI